MERCSCRARRKRVAEGRANIVAWSGAGMQPGRPGCASANSAVFRHRTGCAGSAIVRPGAGMRRFAQSAAIGRSRPHRPRQQRLAEEPVWTGVCTGVCTGDDRAHGLDHGLETSRMANGEWRVTAMHAPSRTWPGRWISARLGRHAACIHSVGHHVRLSRTALYVWFCKALMRVQLSRWCSTLSPGRGNILTTRALKA